VDRLTVRRGIGWRSLIDIARTRARAVASHHRPYPVAMTASRTIVVVGSPTALGGQFGGMEATPGELRRAGLVDRLVARGERRGVRWVDHGDVTNDPGWMSDDDPRARNRARICDYLPRLAKHVVVALAHAGPDARLLALGGDCTSHAGALAGLRRAGRGARLGLAWFDAHGDFNTPDTTPSGDVWGMPFAMACGRGDTDLVAAVDGPTVRATDAALLGGQVLDEMESRALALSGVAQFGPATLADPAGRAALAAWAGVVSARVDGWYIAVDLDAIDASSGLSVAMPEHGGLDLATALLAIGIVAGSGPVVGFGATAAMARPDIDFAPTADAIARLAETALAGATLT
jgi:arginase